ncbi:MAG TPA: sugar transferase [Candidatus Saccharimonadia bacterium]|nr:sugar transferase [Candidatus Saccharimonadia bacterium]
MRKRSELFFSVILVPLDFLALLGAFAAAYIIRVKLEDKPVAHPIPAAEFVHVLLILLPLWIVIFALSGLYVQSNLRGKLGEIGKVFVAVSGGVMLSILLDFFQPQSLFPSKAVPIYAYGLGLVFVLLSRTLVRWLQRWLFQFGVGVHNAVIIGSGEIAQRMVPDLQQAFSGYRLLACVDRSRGAAKRMRGVPVFDALEEAIAAVAPDGNLDEIIQADSALEQDEILALVNYAANHQIGYRFVPNQFGLYASNSVLGTLAGVQMIEIRLTPLDGWGRVAKRVFDLMGSALAIVVLSPLLVGLALLIKLRDPSGPVLYRHHRLSRSGRSVGVLKFRTMEWRYCDGPGRPFTSAEETLRAMGRPELIAEFKRAHKIENDPRVSRFGRFLRRTSLDELPQFLNVLKGEMSLVGPRPIVAAELDHYGQRGATFLALKPGMTGLWQISGRSDISYDDRVKLDIYYVEHWGLLLDTKILLKTALTFLAGKGAY